MASGLGSELRRPVPLTLAIIAVVGWIVVIYLASSRASIREDLTERIETAEAAQAETAQRLARQEAGTGTVEELESRIETLGTEAEQLTAERDMVQRAVEEARATLSDLESQVEARNSELQALDAELAPKNEQLRTFETRLSEAEEAVVARTEELAEVGRRLEEARAQEAEIQQQLASLTEDASKLSQDAAEAEQRVQQAREAEATLQSELEAARAEFARIEQDQVGLERAVRELEQRRTELTADNAAAQEQRQKLQAEVTEYADTLAMQIDRLAELERRVGGLYQEGASVNRAVAAGLAPGRYTLGPITAQFAADGTFEMAGEGRVQSVTGTWMVENDVLALTDVSGDTGAANFPMRCGIAPEPIGFQLSEHEGSCAVFDGETFQRQE
jgi:chromosome segregation ATPase